MTTKAGLIVAASHALQNSPQLFARVEDGGVVIGGGGGEVVPDSTGLYAVVAQDPDAVRAELRLDTSVSRSDVLYIGKAEGSLRARLERKHFAGGATAHSTLRPLWPHSWWIGWTWSRSPSLPRVDSPSPRRAASS